MRDGKQCSGWTSNAGPGLASRLAVRQMRWLVLALMVTTVDAQTLLEGNVVGITDGDTLTLLVDRTQHKVRLDTFVRATP